MQKRHTKIWCDCPFKLTVAKNMCTVYTQNPPHSPILMVILRVVGIIKTKEKEMRTVPVDTGAYCRYSRSLLGEKEFLCSINFRIKYKPFFQILSNR